MEGTIINEKRYVAITLMEAIKPNSNRMRFCIAQKTAKPIEVVKFAKKREMLVRSIAKCSDFNLLPVLVNSVWYLFRIKTQFGTPMTMISGGINPLRTLSL